MENGNDSISDPVMAESKITWKDDIHPELPDIVRQIPGWTREKACRNP